ncbi:MAG: membrane protein insertase YidC [Treponema sp.]|nr:membrane protein insertase YidC [Treponema sp.]MCL2250860.1 membrane protein insertase YidC [Treponema sp.]
MDKKTILAIVLSSIVLIVSFVIQGVFFPPKQKQSFVIQDQQTAVTAVDTTGEPQINNSRGSSETHGLSEIEPFSTVQQEIDASVNVEQEISVSRQLITINTEFFIVVLTNEGGDIVSFRWKDPRKHPNDSSAYVDLILTNFNEAQARSASQVSRAFSVAFGDHEALPVSSNFNVNRLSNYSVEFYRDFVVPSSANSVSKFRLSKRYEFKPSDYMFELKITLDGGNSMSGFNFNGNAYTLSFGPQIGPQFAKLDNLYDYRHLNIYSNGKRRDAKYNESIDRPSWAAISGKYFAFIAYPYQQYTLRFSNKEEPGLSAASRVMLIRPSVSLSKIEDTYRFYLGPKTHDILGTYNTGKNEFNIRDAHFAEIASSRGIWGILAPLERVLKWLLLRFYDGVKNYGIAIILLTLLIKLLFFPLTKKGSEATQRMQALTPKIKELQEKYKNNQQKLQTEMANFYKQEGYNPLSGCLPMLLQLPIFIAMYNLFNNHFDLRGAGFISGWIPDLSLPEAIWNFPEGVRLPILGWTALRALPFIYVASQLLYSKVTQMPGQQSNAQMKMMLYAMPIIFFFVLYNVPSGLLIYWIFSNLLTLVQQLIINKYIIKKRAAETPPPSPPPVIAPPPGGGKKKKSKR